MKKIPLRRRPVLTEEEKRRRADRFTWQPGDLKIYSSLEEFEKECEKKDTKAIEHDNETPKDNG